MVRHAFCTHTLEQRSRVMKVKSGVKGGYYHADPDAGGVCLGGGTPVRTRAGLRPIETLRVGDHVLTQDARTGDLTFRPIEAVFHSRPGETLRIDLGGEVIVATPSHPFWLAGTGWVPARDLRPGDALRTPG